MATDRLKPGDVIGSALEIYGSQVWVLIPAAVAVFAILAVARVIFTGTAVVLVSILSIVLTTFYQGMVVELVRDVQDGRRENSVGQLFGSVAPIVLPLIGLSLVVGLGVVAGFVLLILPGVYLMTIWAVAAPSYVIERRGVFAAIGRSRELVKGHGWQVLGVIAIILVLALITGVAVVALASGLGNGGVAVVQWAANVIVSPFTALVGAVMYFSLRRLHGETAPASASGQPASESGLGDDPPSLGL